VLSTRARPEELGEHVDSYGDFFVSNVLISNDRYYK